MEVGPDQQLCKRVSLAPREARCARGLPTPSARCAPKPHLEVRAPRTAGVHARLARAKSPVPPVVPESIARTTSRRKMLNVCHTFHAQITHVRLAEAEHQPAKRRRTVERERQKMKKIKKLTLQRETLRDLTTHSAGEVKGGAKTKRCQPHSYRGATMCGYTCPTGDCTGYTCYNCGSAGCW